MNHYPLHIGDWMTATAHLSMIEECVYSRLIDQYYSREGPLPLDVTACCRLVRASTAQERAAVSSILKEFFIEAADGWRQSRCDEEIERYQERSELAKKSAKASVESRERFRQATVEQKTEMPPTGASADAERTLNERSTNAQLTNSQEPIANKGRTKTKAPPAALPDWLAVELWDDWRKHRGRKLTEQAAILQIRKLSQLRADGFVPEVVIPLAIESGWATFYPPKQAPPLRAVSAADKRAATAAAMYGHRREDDAIDGVAERVA